ncbi:hypothetical protein AVEN_119279-1 [Araneus ventricosus]|uniref:Uncharacterized protein n=1 Tax=Araneus ventricosus TaxID=182803 RepID=A0A4Y2EFA6_ARAVE|nr:hypothetical protein AVEN_119279-1 [Araneus ventricosus]
MDSHSTTSLSFTYKLQNSASVLSYRLFSCMSDFDAPFESATQGSSLPSYPLPRPHHQDTAAGVRTETRQSTTASSKIFYEWFILVHYNDNHF